MKKLFTLAFAVLSVATASAQYVCTTPGATFSYRDSIFAAEKPLEIMQTNKIASVDTDKKGILTVTVDQQQFMADAPEMSKSQSSKAYFNPKDSTTTLVFYTAEEQKEEIIANIKQSIEASGERPSPAEMDELMNSISARGEISLALPQGAAVDTKIPNKSLRIGVATQNFSINLWKGKVLGYETVTLPCGTFENCIKVTYEIKMDMGESQKMTSTDWYAPGIGLVRQVVTYKKDEPFSSTELVSFTK